MNNADLESVRHVKMQMNRMITRVRKMQTELEKLLDDDEGAILFRRMGWEIIYMGPMQIKHDFTGV